MSMHGVLMVNVCQVIQERLIIQPFIFKNIKIEINAVWCYK